MRKLKKLASVLAVLILGLTMLAFMACPSSADSSSSGRKAVKDGTYETTGIGKSVIAPISVSTTFVNNVIINISIGANEETGPILDTVKSLFVPRIIEAQSIGVDTVGGATMSSLGVRNAVAAAIDLAGGKSEQWEDTPKKSSKVVQFHNYDVIVVGLGGAGMAAYVKASEPIGTYYPSVFGIEVGGKVGGNSATAGGPMAINSAYIKNLYTGGTDYAHRDALLKEWYADMEAQVPPAEIPPVTSFSPPYGPGTGSTYTVPTTWTETPPYQGGPKWEMIKQLIDESGETVSWLGQNYNFHFTRPGGLAYPQYQIVANYGSEHWVGGAYSSDDGEDLFKTTMFTRAIETAKARNPRSMYKLELRATGLIMSEGKAAGVRAKYRDGTTYEIYGKTVILATGGFIANSDMKLEYFESNMRTEAVDTERGDGIKMALDAGAGTYNITMPAMVHIAQVRNIIQEQVETDRTADLLWKANLSNLLMKADSLVVGLEKGQTGDLRGKRFCNEGGFFIGSIAFENWKVGGHFAAIYSDDVLDAIKASGWKHTAGLYFLGQGNPTAINTPIANLDTILQRGEQYGNVIKAATLDELAQKLKIDTATLTATINEYNGYVDSGTDSVFGKSAGQLTTKIKSDNSTGYTAILGAGYYYGTTGGLDVDTEMRVLNNTAAHTPIPGLYAIGQDSMGVLFNAKKAYVGYGAAAQGWAITSGRIAGEKAAAYAQAN
jgi:uncharacterized protein with FMN-binding domain